MAGDNSFWNPDIETLPHGELRALQLERLRWQVERCYDQFNARAAVGEFSVAFKELEVEQTRLQSEEELARQVEMIQRLR